MLQSYRSSLFGEHRSQWCLYLLLNGQDSQTEALEYSGLLLTPSLNANVHLGLRRMWNCVATEFDIRAD